MKDVIPTYKLWNYVSLTQTNHFIFDNKQWLFSSGKRELVGWIFKKYTKIKKTIYFFHIFKKYMKIRKQFLHTSIISLFSTKINYKHSWAETLKEQILKVKQAL